jgi:hypothetical protein
LYYVLSASSDDAIEMRIEDLSIQFRPTPKPDWAAAFRSGSGLYFKGCRARAVTTPLPKFDDRHCGKPPEGLFIDGPSKRSDESNSFLCSGSK